MLSLIVRVMVIIARSMLNRICMGGANPVLIGQPKNLMNYHSGDDGRMPARAVQKWIKFQRFDLLKNGSSESYLLASR